MFYNRLPVIVSIEDLKQTIYLIYNNIINKDQGESKMNQHQLLRKLALERIYICTILFLAGWQVNNLYNRLRQHSKLMLHLIFSMSNLYYHVISINLLVVYRESVNLIGYITRRLSADSLQL